MAKPVVDGLERDMKDKLRFARVDIGSDEGSDLAQKYGISAVPAFVVLDGNGRVVYRQVGGRPKTDDIKAQIARLPR